MENKVYVKDLHCYQIASKEQRNHKLVSPNRYFDLDKLPTVKMKAEMRAFVLHRGEVLSLMSIRHEFWPYHMFCRFLTECNKSFDSIQETKQEQMLQELKKWLLKNGYSITKRHYRNEIMEYRIVQSDIVGYVERIFAYFAPRDERREVEKDVWKIQCLEFPVRNNPVHPIQSLNFQGITQNGMREELKRASAMTLRHAAAPTVANHIRAVKRFSEFLRREAPDVQSFLQLDREMLEAYLIFIHTECQGKKSFRSELQSLKSVIHTIGKVYDCEKLCQIFLPDDIPCERGRTRNRAYSDEELIKLNKAIADMDEQIARVLILHQMLGNRISETLTLKKDCLVNRGGHRMVSVFQIKSQRTCYKPANEDIVKLIQKSIAYTEQRYGETEYIFVYDKDPAKPMKYAKIQRQLMTMIRQKDLRDDDGRLFGVGTHTFRHSYGRRLTEMHVDDDTIAKLLGHANTNTVRYYRKFGNQGLAAETKEVRDTMDEILSQIIEEW